MLHFFKWKNPGHSALTAALENKPHWIARIEKSLRSYEKGLPDYYSQETAKVRTARDFSHLMQGNALSDDDKKPVELNALPDAGWAGLASLTQFAHALAQGRNGNKEALRRAQELFCKNFQGYESLALATSTQSFEAYAQIRDWAAKTTA